MDLSEVLDVQAVLSDVPTCLGDNGSVMRRHVQLVGSSAFLGTQFRMVARFEDHFALNEMAVGPLRVTKLKIVFKPLYATSQSNYGSLRRHHCVEYFTPYHVVAGIGAITTQDNKL